MPGTSCYSWASHTWNRNKPCLFSRWSKHYLRAVGLTIQAIGLFITNVIPRWQSALLLGVWLMGFPDGWEIVALIGSIRLTIALVPLGIRMLTGETPLKQKLVALPS